MNDAKIQIKKTKRKVALVLFIALVMIIGFGYWKFFSLQGVPKGELIRTVKSPDGKHAIKTYFHNAGSLSADAVRGELVNLSSNSAKNVYWNYPDTDPHIEWIDKDRVRIGDRALDISKKETYDWREDDKHIKEYPKQFVQ
ncbi:MULTISPECIES: DUF5412 domain-containing protein [Bacillus]|uniref:DUF5412 domain-containing protein n=1 Tax=Bacillus TaxID=1386 RepID=UPI0001A18BF7|nr:DUF5412 domain-containing protein [Bacillus pseudomycoides]EEM14779.1 hypothetical protein bpmyx0001_42690 [Bacillus pseudomycoides DSM 12442]MED1595369.1 DUF5412 domain-containing protein [Bacillus pseudomycoides]MED4712307.1 DUF5412 domain-containing protein [Bacillus pseudomycoides]OOR50585.1 hypothetical protein BLX05_18165 [Bacillus pseudomycoides]PDY13604.1 hypothetical protein COO16_06115 [Bacillus pseudomycoides]